MSAPTPRPARGTCAGLTLFVGMLLATGSADARIAWNKAEVPVTPASEIELQALLLEQEQAFRSYERAGISMRDEIRAAIQREGDERIAYIKKLYDAQLQGKDEERDSRRADAIRLFERFIERYPSHAVHTPDTMFRLAELYYEQAQVDYMAEQDSYDDRRALYERGKIAEEPASPEPRYDRVISTLSSLTRRFPAYRFTDAALYLLGYTQLEAGEDEAGKQTYLTLVADHPKSEYAPEALLRLGEVEFDYAEFEQAAEYYKKVMDYPDSEFFDLALYKLAWSYYQMFDYDRAIKTFKDLIAHYDRQKTADGALEGREGQLRGEAVDYVAKALAEHDWDGDGVADAGAGLPRVYKYLSAKEGYEREVLAAHAQVLYELHDADRYREAIKVYEKLVRANPVDPENPRYHEQVIRIYDTLRDFKGAATARGEMGKLFGKESAWYRANQENGEALERASMLVEVAVHQSAQFHHLRAQELKLEAQQSGSSAKAAESVREYELAAKGYGDFVDRYPGSPKVYDALFFRAEALYYAGQFEQASLAYAQVRDHERKTRYREESAFSAIKSMEKAIERQVERKRLPAKALPSGVSDVEQVDLPESQEAEITRVTPEQIPAEVATWVQHLDRYVELDLKREDDPESAAKFAYQAAEMHYRFRHFDEARARLEKVLDTWPGASVAASAAAIVINSYKVENDWPNIQKWAKIMEEKNIGRPEEQAQIKAAIRVFSLGAKFKTAEQLLEQKKFLEAAEEFERLADEPDVEFADKALFNAAMAFIQDKRYERASKAFERILTEPRFKDSQFREQALFQVAENSKKFFDFQRATSSYLALYRGNAKNENSPYALFQAATLLSEDGRYDEAARLFEEYERVYSDRSDAAAALYKAATAWQKAGNQRSEEAALNAFIKRGRPQLDMGNLVLESLVRLGDIAQRRGQDRKANSAYKDAIALYRQRNYGSGTEEAEHAAKASFELVEVTFRRYEGLKLQGSLAQMGKQIQQSQALLKELVEGYSSIFPFGVLDWTFASFFRIGQVHQIFAQKLYDAPEPRGLSEEELDVYRVQLEDEGAKWEDAAVARYEEMIREARKRKVTNEWVKKALVFLNGYKPQEYPLAKQEKDVLIWDEAWSFALTDADGGVPGGAEDAVELLHEGRFAEARAAADRASGGADGVYAAAVAVRALILQGDAPGAVGAAQRFAEGRPDDIAAQNLALFALSQTDRASVVLREARALLTKDELNTETMRNIARAYMALNKLDTARFVLRRALDVQDEAQSHRLLGEIAFRNDKLTRARDELEQASKASLGAPEVLNNLGLIAARMVDYQGAASALERLASDFPKLAFGHANLGYVYRLMGRPDDAASAYNQALSLDSRLAEASYNLGMLYFATDVSGMTGAKRFKAAMEALNRYRDLRRNALSREENEEIDRYLAEAQSNIEMLQQSGQDAGPAGADDFNEGDGGGEEFYDDSGSDDYVEPEANRRIR